MMIIFSSPSYKMLQEPCSHNNLASSFSCFFVQESFPDADDVDVPENLQRPFRLSFEKVTEKTEPGKRPIERF